MILRSLAALAFLTLPAGAQTVLPVEPFAASEPTSEMIEGDPIIAQCADTPFGGTVAIRAPLAAALTERKAIAGA
jgi:hypothetical protein